MCVYLCANLNIMAEAKYYLQVRKDTEKNIPLILKYSFGGSRLEYYTGIRIDKVDYVPMYWKKRNGKPIRPSAPKSAQKNDEAEIILSHLTTAKNAAKAAGTPLSVKYLRDYLDEKLKGKNVTVSDAPLTFFEYFDMFIEGKKNAINQKTGFPLNPTNARKYRNVKNVLTDFVKYRGAPIDWPDFDEKLYNELVKYMIDVKKYALNTYGRHIKFLKTVLHKSIEKGYNTNVQFIKGFKGVTEPSDNVYLTEDELELLYKHDFSRQPRLERVRDVFLVGCYTGLRFSDYTNIRPENINGDRIRITQTKTKQPVIIPVHPRVREILEKYNYQLPPAISNQKFNAYLGEICEDAKINEPYQKTITRERQTVVTQAPKHQFISSHSARRTFATNAYRNGIPPSLIMAITGHRTESEFMKYIRLTGEEKADQFAQAWERINGNKK